jgi:hypothetical protein
VRGRRELEVRALRGRRSGGPGHCRTTTSTGTTRPHG